MQEASRRTLGALAGLLLFVLALEVLRRQLHTATWTSLHADLRSMPRSAVLLSLLFTASNYAVLTSYDFLALAYVGRRLTRWKVALASFVAYAIANNVGFAVLSGASVRYRFYTRWGITGEELSRIVLAYSATFWLGLLFLGGLSLVTRPWPDDLPHAVRTLAEPAGWLLLLVPIAYVGAAAAREAPIAVGQFRVPLPRLPIAIGQLAASVIDWTLAASVLHVLLPAGSVPFVVTTSAFVSAQLIGLASHVPGGLGVFDGLMVVLLGPYVPSDRLLPALVVYRFVYYLLPLGVALVGLVADEVRQRRSSLPRARALFGRLEAWLTPKLLATFVFLAGAVLLFSGATPSEAARLALLTRLLPLGVVETSHFLGGVTGMVLILLSQPIARRLHAAYRLTIASLAIGIVVSMLKGVDVEDAIVLGVLLALLVRSRADFGRRAALFATRFSAGWIAAVAAAFIASVWLGLFAFKHVEYSHALWWQFAWPADASRALRASVGAGIAVLVFAALRLAATVPHEIARPAPSDLEDAARIIAADTATHAYLVYLGDKGVIFNRARTGFLMYGAHARTWAAMGDPIGPPAAASALIREFLERCDDYGCTPVFYDVGPRYLHRYADFGLTSVPLGHEARVDLAAFTMQGGRARGHRLAISRLAREGGTFRVAPPGEVAALMSQLREVSDAWLGAKHAAEKGFSLGAFDPAYLARFPIAIVERRGRIEAFANLWPGADGVELAIDLMRRRPDAPKNVMEALVVHLLRWAQASNYRWLGLGMAPMPGFAPSPVTPLWTRLGGAVYRHGGRLYNFQGLREFKEKFHPQWEPRYFVYPGGIRLPRALADVSSIVAGGYRIRRRGDEPPLAVEPHGAE
ncbi:MAG: bifunctional lysylphosphatidylglycerol flippase/synthetase MprF [Acidobacteria bacterium]|nr:bifunctional lysylphosphatidylglycerol flippase/synthetase MprF [Acidobacteriota bacterium]